MEIHNYYWLVWQYIWIVPTLLITFIKFINQPPYYLYTFDPKKAGKEFGKKGRNGKLILAKSDFLDHVYRIYCFGAVVYYIFDIIYYLNTY